MCANSEGSDEPEPSLVAYVVSTIIAWAGALLPKTAQNCEKLVSFKGNFTSEKALLA